MIIVLDLIMVEIVWGLVKRRITHHNVVSLTPDQYAQVQKIFHKSTTLAPSANMASNFSTLVGDKDIFDRIIDSGATNHMVCHFTLLSDITDCKEIGDVYLPNFLYYMLVIVG